MSKHMCVREWIVFSLEKTFGWFDWNFVSEDDSELDEVLDEKSGEPKGNFAYLLVRFREDENDFNLTLYENLNEAKDNVKDQMNYGDCSANGGRGGPDYKSEFVILDLVERKVIYPSRSAEITFAESE